MSARTRDTLQEKPVGIRRPVGQGLQHRRHRPPADLRHHPQATESHWLALGTATCLNVGSGAPPSALPAPARRQHLKSSDFPDPTINTYACSCRTRSTGTTGPSCPACATTTPSSNPSDRGVPQGLDVHRTAPTRVMTAKNWHRVSPKFGLTYALTTIHLVRPVCRRLPHPDRQGHVRTFENRRGVSRRAQPGPETGEEQELETGLRGNFDAGNFDVAVFYNKYRDFINEDARQAPLPGQVPSQQHQARHHQGRRGQGRLNLDAFGAPPGSTPRARWPTPMAATTTPASR